MSTSDPFAGDTSHREIRITRLFTARRELVFRAWTDPKHLANWWGPNGFTTTTYSMDFRAGGIWRFVMHGPDGRDYQNQVNYKEITPPERLVYSHGGDGCEPVSFNVMVTFVEEAGKTRVTLRMVFPTTGERDHVVQEYGAVEGGNQTLARLAEYVQTLEAA